MEFTIGLHELICYILIFILTCSVFYIIGNVNSIINDIKSLDYDNIKRENEELKRCIQIKKKRG